jgi:arabinofuranan 3-O-arabinosyltransferase
MATCEISRPPRADAKLPRPLELLAFALVVAHAVYLSAAYLHGIWIVAPDGSGVQSDFVNVWAAGRLVLEGHPASAYDAPTHKLVEEAAVGHPFPGYFGWPYPPPFLFVAAGLALLSFAIAYAVWIFGTFPIYLAAIRAIIGDRTGYLLAAAFPAVLGNFIVGQNGFLTAGLFGGALILLERRPLLAGILIGLLSYKPHLGFLFPIALAAGGYWRAFAAATATAVLMAVATWLAFGTETWTAFFANIGHTERAFLSEGAADLGKMQSVFGLIRTLGGSEALAWCTQAAVAVAATIGVAAVWRSRADYEIKAAALGTASMLATPYLFIYDLVVLAVPLAFLFRLGRARGFLPQEMAGIGVACLLILIFPFVKVPVGFAAIVVVAAQVARRAIVPFEGASVSA